MPKFYTSTSMQLLFISALLQFLILASFNISNMQILKFYAYLLTHKIFAIQLLFNCTSLHIFLISSNLHLLSLTIFNISSSSFYNFSATYLLTYLLAYVVHTNSFTHVYSYSYSQIFIPSIHTLDMFQLLNRMWIQFCTHLLTH